MALCRDNRKYTTNTVAQTEFSFGGEEFTMSTVWWSSCVHVFLLLYRVYFEVISFLWADLCLRRDQLITFYGF